jgi:hypothetical protein
MTRENVPILGFSDHSDTGLMTTGRDAAGGFFLKQWHRGRLPFAC